MKHLIILLIPLLGLLSCRSNKQLVIPPERVVTQIERMTEVRWDTAYIEVPAQSAEVVIQDSVSHLETDFATSDARINPDGTLYHNLKNKPQERPAVVPTTVQRIDSIVEREVPVPVYIDKPPNKVDKFKIGAFWWLFGGFAALLAILFRKPIDTIIKRLF